MNETALVRGLDVMAKKKEEKELLFIIMDVGPSTELTNEELHKTYVELNEYRDGKTFNELLDEANNPSLLLKHKPTHNL